MGRNGQTGQGDMQQNMQQRLTISDITKATIDFFYHDQSFIAGWLFSIADEDQIEHVLAECKRLGIMDDVLEHLKKKTPIRNLFL